MKITNDVRYIGVNDHEIDLFEGQYLVENGMAYNSYVIVDEKVAVLDTVDAHFGEQWLKNLAAELAGRQPDYLVVHHMEPDHSANIAAFAAAYPAARIVATAKAFTMMKQFYGTDYADRRVVVAEGDALTLGAHTLTFLTAPMVHWPEVAVSYDATDKILFSADGFGKFGALDVDEEWACEARRYYFGIVGKYGAQVQALLKKVSALDIAIICPLHGPVLTAPLDEYLSLYNTWSSYTPEDKGTLIAYASVYGGTRAAAELLAAKLRERDEKVAMADLTRDDMAEAVEDAFRYDKLVLASVTYNADVFPPMHAFMHALVERGYKNRTVALMENGTWAPMAAKVMRQTMEGCKNITFTEGTVKLLSTMDEQSRAQIDALAAELCGE